MTDPLPGLVAAFVAGRDEGRALLAEVLRHVGRVARSYPDAWFVLGRKTTEAVDDLGHRVFTTCARVPKGRFPFSGRPPFGAFVAEDFDGRAIRYHSFYAHLSITRELLRADYAHNLASDPRLCWRADLYGEIGDHLRKIARRDEGRPPRWSLGPAMLRGEEALVERLRAGATREVPALVEAALRQGGPRTQPEICRVLEAVIGTPPGPVAEDRGPEPDPGERTAVRAAVRAGWEALDAEERALLGALGRGLAYDEICAEMPRFAHRVAVNRALERIGRVFVGQLAGALGADPRGAPPPKALLELVLDVLAELE